MNGTRARPARFILIGLASTAVYFALLLALRSVIASTTILAALCYALSMCFNYVAQGLWTFQTQRLSTRSLGRYAIVQGMALAINALAMGILVDGLGWALLLSQVLVTGFVAVCVYVLSAIWVYQ